MLRLVCRVAATAWATLLAWQFFGELTRGDRGCWRIRIPAPYTVKVGKFTITRG